jgi:hypothetical protein
MADDRDPGQQTRTKFVWRQSLLTSISVISHRLANITGPIDRADQVVPADEIGLKNRQAGTKLQGRKVRGGLGQKTGLSIFEPKPSPAIGLQISPDQSTGLIE